MVDRPVWCWQACVGDRPVWCWQVYVALAGPGGKIKK